MLFDVLIAGGLAVQAFGLFGTNTMAAIYWIAVLIIRVVLLKKEGE